MCVEAVLMYRMHILKSAPVVSTIGGPARVPLFFSGSIMSVSGFQVARRAAQPRQEGRPTNRWLFVKPLEPTDARAPAHRLSQAHDHWQFHITSKRIHFFATISLVLYSVSRPHSHGPLRILSTREERICVTSVYLYPYRAPTAHVYIYNFSFFKEIFNHNTWIN